MENYERSAHDLLESCVSSFGGPKSCAEDGREFEIALELVRLRLAQLNNCAIGLESHSVALRKYGENEEKLNELSSWLSSNRFNRFERFALALAENLTANPEGPLTKSLLAEGPGYFSRTEIIRLILVIQAVDDWQASKPETAPSSSDTEVSSQTVSAL